MKQKLRKPLAWLLTLAMLITMLPGAALAAEAEHLCSCGTDDESIHATTCAAYVQPENPVCYCVEPCTEANEWCDVCYFDVAACAGSDEVEATGYATTPTYIASLGIAQDAHEGDAKSELSGHTIIDYDLNKGCGSSSDYIYMGYKTTTDPSQAITGIFIRTGENPPASATFDGVTAYLVGGSYEANTAVDNVVDLNEDAGGAYIYVYVTRDTSHAPITEITFSGSSSKDGYTTPNVDLNQGVGGSDDIYLHYKQYSATAYINYYYLSDNFTVVHKQVSGTLKHHLDKMTATPSGASDVIYNGKTAVQIGWREDLSVQNQGESLTTPSVTLETSGKNYYAAYRLSFRSTTRLTFDANGGSGAPSTLVRNDDTRYVTAGKSAFIIEKMAFTIPSTKPTHADKCQFLGWSTNRNATTAAYQPGQTIQVDLDTTLYAVYQQNHSFGSNGFCTKCDAGYQPAVLKNGYYQISNAGQLFWFADYINKVDRTANAVLTADIDLENRPWTPIGSTGQDSNNFRGHFDGQGHTIEGLYVEGGRAGLGFFGEVRTGTVENFTIYGEVVANTDVNYVGGVIGSACGLNSNAPDHNGATIRNITSYVNLTAEKHGIGMVGGFIGYANHETLIENCAWYGTFDAGEYRVDSGAGGFVGRIYDTATVTIRNCAAYGTVKTAYQSGTHDNYDTIYIGGFLSYSPSGAATTLENNLWAGQIINNTNLDANAHLSAYGTMNSDARKTNCYALKGTPYVTTGNDNADGITPVTAQQLQSGEVAYKLGGAWGQNIGEDAYPVLGGAKVYENTDCADVISYSNIRIEGATHDFDENGFCTNCGGYQPAELVDGVYEISNAGQLYWFAAQVNGGKTTINGKLIENITVNTGVLKANGEPNSGSFRVWTPIGNSSNRYAGTFDGNGKTVSGLYFNDGEASRVGLFGYIYSGTVQNVGVMDSYLSGFAYIGGIAGGMEGGGTITGCTNSATVSGAGHHVGGIVGYACGSSTIENSIKNCRNSGGITGNNNVGGIVGLLKYTTAENCYNTGSVSSLGVVGGIRGFNGLSGFVNNSYYLDTCGAAGSGTVKTTAQFASGEVAYLLGDAFGQTIGEEEYPVLGGAKVYSVTCGGNPIYSNSDESYTEHTNVGGFCSVCGVMLCDHSGNENQHTDCTVDFVCSVCGAVITEAAAGHTYGEDDGDCTTAVLCSVCGTAVVAAKAHAFDSNSTCTNDGCTVIGYKLYIGGVQVTRENLTINGTTGTAAYDPETNTLTLNNYTYTGAGYTDEEGDASAIYYNGGGSGTLKLVLVGESVVTHTGTTEEYSTSYGMKVTDFLEISGTGSLKVVGGEVTGAYTNSYGLCVGDDITIWEGSLIAIGGNATSDSFGVSAGEGVLVNGGTLTAIAGNAAEGRYSYGVEAYGLNMGEGIGILTPVGGWYSDADEGWGAVLDASDELAKEVKIGAGHTVSVNPAENGTVTGTGFYAEGDTVTLTVTPNEGYGLETLTVDGEDVTAAVADGTYTFTMPAKNVAVTAAFVQAVTDYDLWVGGVRVTRENLTITDENGGTATYDPEDNILTLDSYTYEGVGYNDAAIYYGGSGTLKLVLVNDSTITHAGNSNLSSGIYADNGSIKISGSGSLTVTADDTPSGQSCSYGINVSRGDLTILSGTVTATGGKASGGYSADSFGIYVRGTITISGGTVTATGGEVVTDDDDTTVGGSSDGIYAYGEIYILGGTVTATGGEAYGDSSGVSAYGGLTLGEGIGILTPMGGKFDAEQNTVVDAAGNIATEVKIAEKPDPVKVQLKLTKEFNDWGKADGFTFNLAAVTENAPMPASPSAKATLDTPLACFGEITFTAAGIYEYTITEVDSGIPGVTYDTSAHKVVVTITENTEGNKLIAEVKYDGGLSLIITNTYTEATLYNLWIGGTQVTSHNAADVFGDGKVSYDAKENTLTLDGYTYEGPGYTWEDEYNSYGAAIYYGDNDTLELVLVNDSTVIHADGTAEYSSGIYADNGSITVSGSGSLKATGGTATGKYGCSYGVFANGNINVSGGTVEATGSNEGYISYGVCTYGTVSVSNNGSLTGTGGTAEMNSYGVLAYEDITVIGSSLTGTGGTATGESSSSYGVYTNCNINVSGGSLSGTSGNAIDISRGVRAYGKVSVSNNGSLTGTGGTATGQHGDSYGVYVDDGITVIGSSLTGTGGTATGVLSESYGVYVSGGNIHVSGGSLSGTSGNATIKSYGVFADGGLTMGEGIGILTPVGGSFDAEQKVIVDADGNIAKTVVIAEKPVTPYDLWVGGAQFTSKNLTINGTTGTATYDPDSNTLTLDGYTYEGAGHTWEIYYGGGYSDKCGAAIYYGDTKPLNLILKGKNTIAHAGSGYGFSYGLFSEGDIVVSEDSAGGSLTVTAGAAEMSSSGVYTYETIQVESGSLSGIGGEAKTDRSYGVYANKGITVNGGSLTGIGGDATGEYGSSFGVYANNNSIKISGDGILTGTGGEVKNYFSDGVFVDGLLEVSGGTLTGTGGASGYCSYGVNADDGIIVTGGSLTGIGGTAETDDSVGVRTGYYSSITVSGGSLKATSGTAGSRSTAVYTSSLDMSEGVELLTPVDGSFDADQRMIFDTDGNIAAEVEIGIACDHSGNENQHTDCTKDLICSVCGGVITEARDSHAYGSAEFVWQADFSAAKVTVTCGICEDVEELDCEISSQWDGDMNTLTFTATAGEYTDTQTIRLAVDGGKLTITNSAAEAGGKVDMFIMVAGYTGGKMNGCQVIEDVTGVTERALTVSGDTFNVFFLKPGTCAPLSVCAEL